MDKEFKESSCSCNKCKDMCKTAPCLGTPKDISILYLAGLGEKLSGTIWMPGAILGICEPIKMIQPKFENGKCVFLNENDLCELHDLGLKPTEGKMTLHSDNPIEDLRETITYQVAMTWKDIL